MLSIMRSKVEQITNPELACHLELGAFGNQGEDFAIFIVRFLIPSTENRDELVLCELDINLHQN
jgi:hypothetical protein